LRKTASAQAAPVSLPVADDKQAQINRDQFQEELQSAIRKYLQSRGNKGLRPAPPSPPPEDQTEDEKQEVGVEPEVIPEESSENDSDDYYSVKGSDNPLYETLTKYRRKRGSDKSEGSTNYDDFTDEEPIYENENLCEEDPIYENIEYSQTRIVEVDGLIRRAVRPKVPPKPHR
jgi:hypothetical protein